MYSPVLLGWDTEWSSESQRRGRGLSAQRAAPPPVTRGSAPAAPGASRSGFEPGRIDFPHPGRIMAAFAHPFAMPLSLDQLEATLRQAAPEQQRTFLARLPHLLDLSASDVGLLKAAERSFAFWDNPDDAVYDRL